MRDVSTITDPIYGTMRFSAEIGALSKTAAVQRLRRVRLSNIDSLNTPGIAGVSRFEHAMGTSYLAQKVGFRRSLDEADSISLDAAALLHDVGITPFGHLLEEALKYAGEHYSHEAKMAVLFGDADSTEVGGIDLQLYEGAQAGILPWAMAVFGSTYRERLRAIFDALTGVGRFGGSIASDIDLDNLDNVSRLAHHMGIESARALPVQLAESIVEATEDGVKWAVGSLPLIDDWLDLRARLYTRLMLARDDFVGKAMLTVAILSGLREGTLGALGYVWTLTDDELLERLRKVPNTETHGRNRSNAGAIIRRWQLGDIWTSSPLWWVNGMMPERSDVWAYGEECSRQVGRECYAHGIPDKRYRLIHVELANHERHVLGKNAAKWLLGVVSPIRAPFNARETEKLQEVARRFFGRSSLSSVGDQIESETVGALFD